MRLETVESLYVCKFSNGQVKVGRSIDPLSRIASHVERVSCVGVELEKSHVVLCVGNVINAEAQLIASCESASESRFGNEWFVGLDYDRACELASFYANSATEIEADGSWKQYLKQILVCGYTQRRIADEIGCSQPSIAQIASGRTLDPSFKVGYGLLIIGRGIGISDLEVITGGSLKADKSILPKKKVKPQPAKVNVQLNTAQKAKPLPAPTGNGL
jgi:transcriptional regulator with XRE-family HTH domain